MLTEIAPRPAPRSVGPTTPLDEEILAVLGSGVLEPREIHSELPSEHSLQQVHARLRVLVNRGVLERVIPENAPKRGPGAGRYLIR